MWLTTAGAKGDPLRDEKDVVGEALEFRALSVSSTRFLSLSSPKLTPPDTPVFNTPGRLLAPLSSFFLSFESEPVRATPVAGEGEGEAWDGDAELCLSEGFGHGRLTLPSCAVQSILMRGAEYGRSGDRVAVVSVDSHTVQDCQHSLIELMR
eukprot:CAMPEP_0114174796 /NCGR_PEP_ID=MMETSP0043_2-20121206/36595_1 /TAXON_ID=464988 /ORGANISM="Hemiselmis andersenii, Strain CCMP644" /LENGTH=151 /DNA_ID=CAMNT_0001272953 /DNA_START=343 /DNA_END=798 /DNA_ORIENTATION=+